MAIKNKLMRDVCDTEQSLELGMLITTRRSSVSFGMQYMILRLIKADGALLLISSHSSSHVALDDCVETRL